MSEIPVKFWHTFIYNGKYYLVNAENFKSTPVSQQVGKNLFELKNKPGTPVLLETEKAFQDLLGPVGNNLYQTRFIKKQPPVVSLDLFIAQQCNMNCIYCYGGGGEYGQPGEMSEKTAFRALDWLWKQRGQTKSLAISFFGGEPLLQFDLLKKIVSYARSLEKNDNIKFSFGLGTNASLLTDNISQYLKENDFHINIGFDGPKEIHDRNRPLGNGQTSYNIIVSKITRLIAAMPENINLRATLWGKGEALQVSKALAEFTPFRYQILPATPGGHCGKNGQVPTADGEDIVQAVQETLSIFIKAIQSQDWDSLDSIRRWLNFAWLLNVFNPLRNRPAMCNLGQDKLAVSISGDCYPCHRFVGWEDFKLGNIFEDKLDRSQYCYSTFPQNPKYDPCWAKLACNGGCLFDHKVRTGDMFSPSDNFCKMIRSLTETAIYLKHEVNHEELGLLREKKIVRSDFCPLDLF